MRALSLRHTVPRLAELIWRCRAPGRSVPRADIAYVVAVV